MEPQNRLANFDTSKVSVNQAWTDTFGANPSMIDGVTRSGVSIMSILFGENPDYMLHGFMPTEDQFTAASAKLRPLVDDAAFQQMQFDWETKRELPTLTSYRSNAVGDKADRQYTFTTKDGQICTDSAEVPYEVEMDAVRLEARNHISGTKAPSFHGDIIITVQCQEGGTLQGHMTTSFFMKLQEVNWIMADGYITQHKEGTDFEMIK